MKRCFIFSHGFGFDKSFWKNLAPYFSEEYCIFLDHGYFGEKFELPILNPEMLLIGVGHSLGLLKLLELNQRFDYLIGLCGFVNFLGNDPALNMKRDQELQTLKEHFELNTISALKSFYTRCRMQLDLQKIDQINKQLLLNDLKLLTCIFHIPTYIPTLILGSKNDIIVPEKILRDNFSIYPNVILEMLEQGMHGLGFLETDTIYERIISFINE